MLLTSWLKLLTVRFNSHLGRRSCRRRQGSPVPMQTSIEVMEERCLLSATVAGTVYQDLNGSGQQDSGETGSAGGSSSHDLVVAAR